MSTPTHAPSGPSRAPSRAPMASLVAALLAVALIALAVVAVRDLAIEQGWTTGTAWTRPAVEALDGLTATTAVVVAGIVAGVLALLLLFVTLKPARRTHRSTGGDTDLWVTPAAVAALARGAADRVPDVQAAEARATRRRVTVAVSVAAGRSGLEETVKREVEQNLAGVARQSVRVRTRTPEETS